MWKAGLAALPGQAGLEITVCHLPPGTFRWNRIEHRLLSHLSMNWRGRPAASHQVIIDTIAAATSCAGSAVRAEPGTASYPMGIKISSGPAARVRDAL